MVTLFFNPRKEESTLKDKAIVFLSRYIDLSKEVEIEMAPSIYSLVLTMLN